MHRISNRSQPLSIISSAPVCRQGGNRFLRLMPAPIVHPELGFLRGFLKSMQDSLFPYGSRGRLTVRQLFRKGNEMKTLTWENHARGSLSITFLTLALISPGVAVGEV